MTLFRIATIIFAFIPLYFGVTGVIFGAAQLASGEVAPAIDNQFRYLSGVYIGVAVMLFYSAGNVARRSLAFRLAIIAVFIGGIGRAVSYLTIGVAEMWQVGAMGLELISPLFILWQGGVIKASRSIIR
ncbi:DUF4345 domain-containing protein [Parasphingorhabdus sp. JC815]|uniref:DUF4345 domain-containing protein n=1 Tax=Parasphingorhabdus sp. JC815 TaxID=3232140 RepID=UPI003457E192